MNSAQSVFEKKLLNDDCMQCRFLASKLNNTMVFKKSLEEQFSDA